MCVPASAAVKVYAKVECTPGSFVETNTVPRYPVAAFPSASTAVSVIGKAEPVGLFIETFGTETADPDRIAEAITQTFDLRPAAIIRDLDLLRPIYAQTAAYGHFGRELPDFTWERTDRAEQLAKLANG